MSASLPPAPSSSPRRFVLLVGVATAVVLLYLLRGVLVPLFFAFLLAYALDPIVDRLELLKVPRAAGALLVMVLISTATATVLILAVPYLIDEFRLAGEQLPEQLRALKERVDPWVWQVFHINLPHTWGELASKIADEMRARTPDLIQGSMVALFGTLNVILIFVATLIVPVFSLYLLIDFDRNVDRAKRLVPRRWAPLVGSIAADVHRTLGGYVRGQLTACLLLSLLYSAGLMMAGLRLAVPIGFITGMLAFVPYVGFGMGLSMAIGMALLGWQGPNHFIAVVGSMVLVQVLDGMVITPRIVGKSVGLRPIEVLMTMMAAATLFGFLGVLLAVPLGAVVKILVGRATTVYLDSDFYRRPPAMAPVDASPEALAELANIKK
ncbi:MAG TPA: AI-2E family transporter, partial [Polyangiaceae bacterium]|nr:AI-2E family transporter [Polyangiaceae bacterium]